MTGVGNNPLIAQQHSHPAVSRMPQARRSRLSLTRRDDCATSPFFWSPRQVACFSFLLSLSLCLQILFIGGLTFYSQTYISYCEYTISYYLLSILEIKGSTIVTVVPSFSRESTVTP